MTQKCHIMIYYFKGDFDMQINRLFEIVYILLEKKTVTAKELAERFEVSVRTIYRDMDVLSMANIPVYANKGKGGGICLMEDFVLDKSILSEEEQNQILFALQGMGKMENQAGEAVLGKLSTIFQKPKTNWIEVDLASWGKNKDHFDLIKEAVLNRKVLKFVYYNSNGEESERQVEPLQIYFKDKAWYLKAFARDRQDYRLFKIARMKNVEILEENFDRELPELIEREPHFRTVELVLEISKKQAYRVYDEFEKENITEMKNGDFLVKVIFPETDWIYSYIMSFGEFVKVISPEYVKNGVRKRLRRSLGNYLII